MRDPGSSDPGEDRRAPSNASVINPVHTLLRNVYHGRRAEYLRNGIRKPDAVQHGAPQGASMSACGNTDVENTLERLFPDRHEVIH